MNRARSGTAWARSLTTMLAVALCACGGGGTSIIDARVDTGGDGDGGVDEHDASVDAVGDDAPGDGAAIDAEPIDAGAIDAGAIDTGAIDTGAIDAGGIDADPIDAGAIDAGAIDAGTIDAGAIDAGAIDAGAIDAAVPATLLGPVPYRSALDSPFTGAPGVTTVFLEDFEDGPVITAPGVTASSTTPSSSFGTALIDSVDLDDGVADGTCQVGCDALFAFGQIDFAFDGTGLGGLPTHAGLVWTDGGIGATITFSAFDASGAILTEVTATGIPDDNYNGGTAEDRFFGVIAPAGVARIRLSNSTGGIEVDHLQWGR